MEQISDVNDHVELVRLWALTAAKEQALIEQLSQRLATLNELCRVQSAGLLSMARQRSVLQEEIEAAEEKRAVADEKMLEFIADAITYGRQA